MLLPRPALVLFALFGLTACGFQPLYDERGNFFIAHQFAKVQVAPIADRTGQNLRNSLITQLYARGRAERPSYRLDTKISETTSTSLAVRKSALSTRANLKMTANYSLTKISNGFELISTSSTVAVSYNILGSQFSTLIAEKNARERATQRLAEDIFSRLAAMFVGSKTP